MKKVDGRVKSGFIPKNYRPEFCDDLIEAMSEGMSFLAWCSQHNLSRASASRWLVEIEDFKKAYEIGYVKALAYYESLMHAAMLGTIPVEILSKGCTRINVAPIFFTLKTRFHKEYSEVKELVEEIQASSRPFITLSSDALEEALASVKKVGS